MTYLDKNSTTSREKVRPATANLKMGFKKLSEVFFFFFLSEVGFQNIITSVETESSLVMVIWGTEKIMDCFVAARVDRAEKAEAYTRGSILERWGHI